MYKPPENSNRVKSMKSIFENNEVNAQTKDVKGLKLNKSKTDLHIIHGKLQHNSLSRQLSDPSKRNIKRTPAFRLPERTFSKDETRHSWRSKSENSPPVDESNIKFADIVSKFNRHEDVSVKQSKETENISDKTNQSSKDSTNVDDKQNLSFLYSKPIPKALRVKPCDSRNPVPCIQQESSSFDSDEEGLSNKCTLEAKNKFEEACDYFLTDTLRNALKKPLPTGPPPKKPPRTFVESPDQLNKLPCVKKCSEIDLRVKKQFTDLLNKTLLNNSDLNTGKTKTKSDPKHMLDKLENALKNNKIRLRKQARFDAGTSGEDSDDNIVIKSKSNSKPFIKNTQTLPSNYSSANFSPCFNLKCLNSFGCNAPIYDQVDLPKSSFFVDCKHEEPVYAEPYQFREDAKEDGVKNGKNIRNSVHYLSSPILDEGPRKPPVSKRTDAIMSYKTDKQVC